MDKTICPNCGMLYRNVFVPKEDPELKKSIELEKKFHSVKVGWWWGFKHIREKYADDPEMLEFIDKKEAEWDKGGKWKFYSVQLAQAVLLFISVHFFIKFITWFF